MSIWQYCVIEALQWLVANNLLYENIQFNHHLLETWEDKFIPFGIMDNIVHYNINQHECEGYATDLNDGNCENDFDAAIAGTGIEEDRINSGCVYSDIDDQRQNFTLWLLPTVANIQATISTIDQPTTTIISYCSNGQLIPLNNWEDPYYFTSAFPFLFLFRTGGHQK